MRLRLFLGVAATSLAILAPAAPQSALGREMLTDDEMADARGGVLVAGNVAFEFGAVVKTYEDGVLSLQTRVNWTPQGAQVQRTTGPNVMQVLPLPAAMHVPPVPAAAQVRPVPAVMQAPPVPAAAQVLPVPAVMQAPPVPAVAQVLPMPALVQGSPTPAAPQGSPVPAATQSAPIGSDGVATAIVPPSAQNVMTTAQSTLQPIAEAPVQQAGAVTVQPAAPQIAGSLVRDNVQTVYVTSGGANIIHQVTQGQLLNILLNTQNNHQFLQSTDITLVLPGFAGFQAGVMQQLHGMRLADDIRGAMNAARH
jgi:hypothetical protein